MKTFFGALATVCAIALCSTAANAAVTVNGPIRPGQVFTSAPPGNLAAGQTMDFFVSGNITSGPISATFGDVGIPAGMFTDLYDFIIPQNGTGSGSVTTTVDINGLNGPTDLDISSVTVDGLTATPVYRDAAGVVCTTPGVGSCGATETFAITNVPIVSGAPNEIAISGLSRGNGSYGGNATFLPAVPEPATWAMMLLGIGAIGFTMRRRRTPLLSQIA